MTYLLFSSRILNHFLHDSSALAITRNFDNARRKTSQQTLSLLLRTFRNEPLTHIVAEEICHQTWQLFVHFIKD